MAWEKNIPKARKHNTCLHLSSSDERMHERAGILDRHFYIHG
jgi:hypothetical protein